MTNVIFRLYRNYDQAAQAVRDLEAAGVPHKDISIVANNADNWYARQRRTAKRVDRDADGVDDRAEGAAAQVRVSVPQRAELPDFLRAWDC